MLSLDQSFQVKRLGWKWPVINILEFSTRTNCIYIYKERERNIIKFCGDGVVEVVESQWCQAASKPNGFEQTYFLTEWFIELAVRRPPRDFFLVYYSKR